MACASDGDLANAVLDRSRTGQQDHVLFVFLQLDDMACYPIHCARLAESGIELRSK